MFPPGVVGNSRNEQVIRSHPKGLFGADKRFSRGLRRRKSEQGTCKLG